MRKLSLGTVVVCGGIFVSVGCGGQGPSSRAADSPESLSPVQGALTSGDNACDGDGTSTDHARFYVPPPNPDAVAQIAELRRARHFRDAARLSALVETPQAVWFTGGSPDEVEAAVHATMERAARDRRVPVLIAYNVPYRDCAQYSAGGATDTAGYDAWIDAFGRGVGDGEALVLLEPDALGIIPYNNQIGGAPEWCQPKVQDAAGNAVPAPGASPAERYAQLNHAVDSIAAAARHASVYLDGTHSSWLGAGEISFRLARAGVQRAAGFFVNASNYQPTPQLVKYGSWISNCLYFASNPAEGGWRLGHYEYCASQYYPATPGDFSTWSLTDDWYTSNVTNAPNPPVGPRALAHFVIDTSRNGRGTLDTAPYAVEPFDQPASVIGGLVAGNWCNPWGAGVGLRPTSHTGEPLIDALVWAKIPGESDGSCDIAGGARAWDFTVYNPWGLLGEAQLQFDPLWGLVDPAAGQWFRPQALQLARNAQPPLVP